jgi:hypothetical protein
MRLELVAEGHVVAFTAVNKSDAADDQAELVARCAFPLFQDLVEVDAWDLHDGHKDDIYVYDREGRLAAYLPQAGEVSMVLSTAEGYANLKSAILSVVGE